MSNWPTIEEILNSPIVPTKHDPFFHSQKFPNFMKRRVILNENYEKTTRKTIVIEKQNHRRTVSEQSPTQRGFQPYGRVAEKVKSIFERSSNGPKLTYDEALENQRIFSFASPQHQNLPSDFKISHFPREVVCDPQQPKKRNKKNESLKKLPHRVPPKPATDLQSLTKSNILVLLTRQSQQKCAECLKFKCECRIADPELPLNLLDNIKKGKSLIEQVKAEKKVKKPKTQVPRSRVSHKRQKSLVFEKLLDSLWKLPVKDKNTIEGTQMTLNHRRQSSESSKKPYNPNLI